MFLLFYLFPKQGSERGEYTIKELDLNRANLIDRRKERFDKLKILIKAANHTTSDSLRNQIIAELRTEANKNKEYSAMAKSVLLVQDIL
jgi:hypothetical protein